MLSDIATHLPPLHNEHGFRLMPANRRTTANTVIKRQQLLHNVGLPPYNNHIAIRNGSTARRNDLQPVHVAMHKIAPLHHLIARRRHDTMFHIAPLPILRPPPTVTPHKRTPNMDSLTSLIRAHKH
ncbi:hypothetical protein HMPREF3166_01395 [Corynebacterium sp. HMSC08A12]|nr:hypothetical protein HMPREF3166_01395 [Corynebacterium sp. HMSC08A12]